MRLTPLILTAPALALALAACDRETEAPDEPAAGNGPITQAPAVTLAAADGKILGEVQAGDGDGGAVLRITATGLPAGTHGVHIHDIGRCEGPGFESAGPHWNPDDKQHGLHNPKGPHRGDLPNVTVGEDGRLQATMTVAGSNLKGSRAHGFDNIILDANGAALVIHAQADDFRSDPSGNSGDRIACAVLGEAGAE